jgi:Tfp pilus assembly protein PilF
MKSTSSWFVLALALGCAGAGIGCNGSNSDPATTPDGKVIKDARGNVLSTAAASKFKEALGALAKHDQTNDWTDASCESVAKLFLDSADEQKAEFYEAKYNAGVAYQRCKNDAKAKEIFGEILSKKADFHRARVQVALYKYADDGNVNDAISEMKRAIEDAKFKNEEALVNLAMLQMKRDGSESDEGCDSDFACAKLNLQRALAINDSFMPAFNQLAVYYLELAKRSAVAKAEKKGKKKKGKGAVKTAAENEVKLDQQALELAALVCSQALRKDPNYAPVHNTSGLISSELGDLSSAARAFATARKLDPKFYEAHMNFAAVNLQFRGFKQAEDAYRQALKLKPQDYEAHLGLALAVRGQINDSNFDKGVKETDSLLQKAKKIAPNRPETYYNEAILTQEFKAKSGTGQEAMLKQAQSLYKEFISKASGKDEFADAVKGAEERVKEIDEELVFMKQSAEEQKKEELERKAREAKEEMEKNQKGGGQAPQ